MRFGFILERGSPPRLNPILAETFARLEARGATVDVFFAEEALWRLDNLRVEADLYLLKSDTELALSLASALEALGGRVLNCVDACLRAKDKVLAAATLIDAGVPTPRSLAAADPQQLARELDGGALILKPNRGYHGAGIQVADNRNALDCAQTYPEMVFAQRYLATARKDLKVFGIGAEIFGVRKAFAADSFLKAGEPTTLPAAVEEAARRCAQAFGLELYGLDIAEDADGISVVDVNYFPGYRGVPEAARRLGDHMLKAARG